MYSGKNCPIITSSTAYITLAGPASDLGSLGERPATAHLKIIYIEHRSSVQTSQRTHRFSITKKKEWMSFNVIISIYFEDHTKQMHAGRSRVRFQMVSMGFFIDLILLAALWPWGLIQPLKKTSNRVISRRVNAAGAYGWQLCHLHAPIVQKFWEPETPGSQKACLRPVMGSLFYGKNSLLWQNADYNILDAIEGGTYSYHGASYD